MYAKFLMPTSSLNIPGILYSSVDFASLYPELTALGWLPYGNVTSPDIKGEVVINERGLLVNVAGKPLLSDKVNPAAPVGWWEAVDAMDGRCLVVVTGQGVLDLLSPTLHTELHALMDTPQSVCAVLPIKH